MQKIILFLGGSNFQLPPVYYAKKQGHYIVVCDYLQDNPARNLADEYHNVSTTDFDAILQVAQRLRIDGIVAYASDPAAATAAYVAAKLGLPGNPYRSVQILSQKDLYRDFLLRHGFHAPRSASFTSLSEAEAYLPSIDLPVMVKPVDSSGSKGVSKIYRADQLPDAFHHALLFSRAKRVIIETYIERKGYQIAGDGFVQNGKLAFRCFGQEHFQQGCDHFVPVGESFPLQLDHMLQQKVHAEIDRLLSLLQLKTGALNFDIVLNEADDVYLIEVGPRAGGNMISEVIKYSTGVDLAACIVDSALGLDCEPIAAPAEIQQLYCCYLLHSNKSGLFRQVTIHPDVRDTIIETNVFVTEGMAVQPFHHSGATLGYLILKFSTPQEMLEKMEAMAQYVHVDVV